VSLESRDGEHRRGAERRQHGDRDLPMGELAERVVLSRTGMTRLVDRIERAGLLRRERATDDRRGAYAVLTDAGVETLRKMWPVYARDRRSLRRAPRRRRGPAARDARARRAREPSLTM
jgi:DNA-binding MarR family transcriptional regulator